MSFAPTPGILYCAECGRPAPAGELARFGNVLVCADCKNSYAQKLREGVAPAAAQLYAGFWIRFGAYLIDTMILAVVGSILQLAFTGSMLNMPEVKPGMQPAEIFAPMLAAMGFVTLLNMAIAACYEGFFIGKTGATPGKMIAGLKVVRADGSPVGTGRAFGRYFAKILSSLTLLIGFIMAGFDSQKRALHDMICDTRVVKAR